MRNCVKKSKKVFAEKSKNIFYLCQYLLQFSHYFVILQNNINDQKSTENCFVKNPKFWPVNEILIKNRKKRKCRLKNEIFGQTTKI